MYYVAWLFANKFLLDCHLLSVVERKCIRNNVLKFHLWYDYEYDNRHDFFVVFCMSAIVIVTVFSSIALMASDDHDDLT